MMAKKAYKVPFDDYSGDQLHYADKRTNLVHFPNGWEAYNDDCDNPANRVEAGVEWREPYEFEDTLKYVTYHRGRSAAYFEFVSLNDGRRYTMFLKQFDQAVSRMVMGQFTGSFGFVKYGHNYGVALLDA
jgi:hypothetical protein